MPPHLVIIWTHSGMLTRLEKTFLAEGESASFTFTEHLSESMLQKWELDDFKELILVNVHDDGKGVIRSRKTLPAE